MNAFFEPTARAPDLPPDDHVVRLDPTLDVEARRRWTVRAAAWRAAHLAELVFGGQVRPELAGSAAGGPFRGLLHLEVPFRGLEDHRRRERIFTASAAADPVLSRVPLVFVFGARPR